MTAAHMSPKNNSSYNPLRSTAAQLNPEPSKPCCCFSWFFSSPVSPEAEAGYGSNEHASPYQSMSASPSMNRSRLLTATAPSTPTQPGRYDGPQTQTMSTPASALQTPNGREGAPFGLQASPILMDSEGEVEQAQALDGMRLHFTPQPQNPHLDKFVSSPAQSACDVSRTEVLIDDEIMEFCATYENYDSVKNGKNPALMSGRSSLNTSNTSDASNTSHNSSIHSMVSVKRGTETCRADDLAQYEVEMKELIHKLAESGVLTKEESAWSFDSIYKKISPSGDFE